MGNLTKVLSHFNHPGGHRIFEWDIQNIDNIHNNIKYVKGGKKKKYTLPSFIMSIISCFLLLKI